MTIPFMGCTLWQIHSWTLKKLYFLVETNLPTPMTTRVCVNFLEGNDDIMMPKSWQHDDEIYNGMMLDDGGYEWYSDIFWSFGGIFTDIPFGFIEHNNGQSPFEFSENKPPWVIVHKSPWAYQWATQASKYWGGNMIFSTFGCHPRHWFVRCV